MLNRRDFIRTTYGVVGASLFSDRAALAAAGPMLTRAIPKTGEMLPMVGLGSSATFASVARSADAQALREVLKTLVDHGGRVFDTAPGYGASEQVAGDLANELGIRDKIFWATKVNAAGREGLSGAKADRPRRARRSRTRSGSSACRRSTCCRCTTWSTWPRTCRSSRT